MDAAALSGENAPDESTFAPAVRTNNLNPPTKTHAAILGIDRASRIATPSDGWVPLNFSQVKRRQTSLGLAESTPSASPTSALDSENLSALPMDFPHDPGAFSFLPTIQRLRGRIIRLEGLVEELNCRLDLVTRQHPTEANYKRASESLDVSTSPVTSSANAPSVFSRDSPAQHWLSSFYYPSIGSIVPARAAFSAPNYMVNHLRLTHELPLTDNSLQDQINENATGRTYTMRNLARHGLPPVPVCIELRPSRIL